MKSRNNQIKVVIRSLIVFVLFVSSFAHSSDSESPIWYSKDANGQAVIHLYFFWSEKCPHCIHAQPDIWDIANDYPWITLHSHELVNHPNNVDKFIAMSSVFGSDARSVPTFMFCGNLLSGYDSKETTGELLRENLEACYRFAKETNPSNTTAFDLSSHQTNSLEIPLLGNILVEEFSLPVLTVLIAGMDAFNPCAFFVLLFLLSLMVHTKSRRKMMLIGSIFVFVSGAMYYVFMAAWLNLFIYLGELRVITFIAGCVAVVVALINIKDYFWFKKGASLSIPDDSKPRLFDRMRGLLRIDSNIMIVVSTVLLAIVANSYEMLCTAGFPMVYTRILTLNALSEESYYLYLLLYNFIYIIPLFVIVIVFTVRLGSRKLTENEGMVLKLLSGIMMLLLGSVLVTSPQLLSNVMVAMILVLLAIFLTWLTVKLTRHKH